MEKRYIQVNIGSHINGEPMTTPRWEEFQDATAGALVATTRGGMPNVSVHYGEGFWNDDKTGELMSEQSAYLSTFADVDTYALRVRLSALRDEFSQDAIALIVGSDLI